MCFEDTRRSCPIALYSFRFGRGRDLYPVTPVSQVTPVRTHTSWKSLPGKGSLSRPLVRVRNRGSSGPSLPLLSVSPLRGPSYPGLLRSRRRFRTSSPGRESPGRSPWRRSSIELTSRPVCGSLQSGHSAGNTGSESLPSTQVLVLVFCHINLRRSPMCTPALWTAVRRLSRAP